MLRNLKIRHRLFLWIGFCSLFLITVHVVSYTQLNTVDHVYSKISENVVPAVNELARIFSELVSHYVV